MKFLFSALFIIISTTGHSQNNDLSNLFFKVPIYESRDSIYHFCTQNYLFKQKKGGKTTRNGNIINTYYGEIQIADTSLRDKNIDSALLQVSTGGQRMAGDTTFIYIIPITSYYYFAKKKSAKIFYSQVADQLTKFTNTKTSNGKVYLNGKLIGYSKRWIKPTNQISDLQVRFKKDAESKKYSVIIECVLYE